MLFHLRTIFDPNDFDRLTARIDTLKPGLPAQWGRMNAHQAVCHLNDSLKATLGDRPIAERPLTIKKRIVRFVGFTLPFPWPKGRVRTSPEADQLKGGTPPGEFSKDVAELKALLDRVRKTDGQGLPRHYAWGELSRNVLGRYVFRHVDHHIRQFRV